MWLGDCGLYTANPEIFGSDFALNCQRLCIAYTVQNYVVVGSRTDCENRNIIMEFILQYHYLSNKYILSFFNVPRQQYIYMGFSCLR